VELGMKPYSVFVPRGRWMIFVVLWAAWIIVSTFADTAEAARSLSDLDCRSGSAAADHSCLSQREGRWFLSLAWSNLPWLLVIGVAEPVLAQAAARALGRRMRADACWPATTVADLHRRTPPAASSPTTPCRDPTPGARGRQRAGQRRTLTTGSGRATAVTACRSREL
jgi:hypothetical protein